MSKMPLISVIIPVYNVEKYLRKCVDSVIDQTYKNLEIILVDDGSTDNSGAICDEYIKKDKRIQVIHQKNRGLSAARNTGIKIAKGEYFSFIDSDDWVDVKFIETLCNLAKKYKVPLCVVGEYIMFPTDTRRGYMLSNGKDLEIIKAEKDCFSEQQALHTVFADYGYKVINKLFSAEIFKQVLFPEGLFYEDIWILFKIVQRINKIVVCDTPLYYYNRQNENSVSRGKFNIHMLDYFIVTDEMMERAKELKDKKFVRKIQRARISHIIGFFKRMMLSNFSDYKIIKKMQSELRKNIWVLLLSPRPLLPTAFALCCCVSFCLTKKLAIGVLRCAN